MKLAEDIKSVSYVKSKTNELLRTVEETRRPVVITQHGNAKGVLLDVASYEKLRNGSLMFKLISQAEADVKAGRTAPQEEVFTEMRETG